MKVLILHSCGLHGYPSGEEKVARRDLANLRNNKIEVKLILIEPEANGYRWWRYFKSAFGAVWSSQAYRRTRSEIIKFEPDVVHFHSLTPFLSPAALAAAHDSGVAVVQTLHNVRWLCVEGGFHRKGRYCDDCVVRRGWIGVLRGCNHGVIPSALFYASNLSMLSGRRLFKLVDKFIAVSEFIRDVHIAGGFPAEKIVIKNNAVDRSLSDKWPLSDRKGVAYVSRLTVSKGTEVMKTIIAASRVEIHVVGDGPELCSLKEFCQQNAYEHVIFWGKQTSQRCSEIMASVQCTIVPSQCGEAFSLVAAESMNVATPVVGSDIGGLGSLLRDSRGGFSVPHSDAMAFVAAIRQLVDDGELARQLGEQGKAYVEQNLNASVNALDLLDIYNNVLRDKALREKLKV